VINMRPIPTLPTLRPLGHLSGMRHDILGLQQRALREVGDIARLRMGVRDVLMISSPAYAQELLVERVEDWEKSAALTSFTRPIIGDGILSSHGSRHKRRRAIVAPAFQANRIARYAEAIIHETDRVLDSFKVGGQVDFGHEMLRLTLEIVGSTLFNAKVAGDVYAVGKAVTEGSEAVTELLRSLLFLPPTIFTGPGRKLIRAGRDLDRIVYRIIRERRGSGEDPGDVLSMLLSARDSEGMGLSDEELRDEAMTLFLAGHETTANALTWALSLVSAHPEVALRLEQEVDALGARAPRFEDLGRLPYAMAVFKETMRLYPPAYLLGRVSLTQTSIGGYRIARGQHVFVNVFAIHRRADLFPEPDSFRPERFLDGAERRLPKSAYMPFGGGPRVCVGNHFALMEGQLVLARLAQRFALAGSVRGVEARSGAREPKLPDCEPLITLRPKQTVSLRVVRRDLNAPRQVANG